MTIFDRTIFDFTPLQEAEPPATLGFAHATLDRAAHLRGQAGEIARLERAREARFLAFSGDQVVLARRGEALDALFEAASLPLPALHRERIFLGIEDGAPRFAQFIEPAGLEALGAEPGLALMGVRQMAAERPVSPAILGAIALGKALTFWHWKHRFCAQCGQGTTLAQGGWRRDCAACGAQHFPRTDPVVIMLIVDGERCILGRQARFVAHTYSTLAGFVEPGETIEAAVRRECREEAGLAIGRVRLLLNQPWPLPLSLMIGAVAEATSFEIVKDEEELEDCRWFSRDEVLAMLEKRHPDGLMVPPRLAIANHLIRLFVGLRD